ncbi:acetyltransferase [Vibrio cholerae]|nr:acetyltransferase [Vibrio cholerae]
MVAVVVFEFSVMRCQPLRRALGAYLLMLDRTLRTNSCND